MFLLEAGLAPKHGMMKEQTGDLGRFHLVRADAEHKHGGKRNKD